MSIEAKQDLNSNLRRLPFLDRSIPLQKTDLYVAAARTYLGGEGRSGEEQDALEVVIMMSLLAGITLDEMHECASNMAGNSITEEDAELLREMTSSVSEKEEKERLGRWNVVNKFVADEIYSNNSGRLFVDPSGEGGYVMSAKDGDDNGLKTPHVKEVAPELHDILVRLVGEGYSLSFNDAWLRAKLVSIDDEVVASSNLQIWSFSEVVTYFGEQAGVVV